MNETDMNEQEARKIDAEIAGIIALAKKHGAETEKMRRESMFYPIIVTSTATLAIVALAKLFL